MATYDNPYGIAPAGFEWANGTPIYLDIRCSYTEQFGTNLRGLLWHILVKDGESQQCALGITFDRPQGHIANYVTARVYHKATNPLHGFTGLSYDNSLLSLPSSLSGENSLWVVTDGDPLLTATSIAHELGHKAGLKHDPDPLNFMAAGLTATGHESRPEQRGKIFYGMDYLLKHRVL